MATSRAAGRAVTAWLESRKNLAGCACGVAGVGLTLAGVAGAYWPVVVGGLYAVGALLAPPERPVTPAFPDRAERLEAVREDFDRLREYLAEVELPPAAGGKLAELLEWYATLLDPGWVAQVSASGPEAVHALARAIREDLPESVDTYNRTRWWSRLQPGTQSPERHLERQLAALFDEAEGLARGIREAEDRRRDAHTRYLEGRGGGT
ncbi:hypothetical protein ACN20G_08220 [Streptomyces sp. BI20]|uniref:hypothetical protein n=1 Tax=Streptomyces sp. BI20 TaxID=3403460 RepID=UPI003C708411